MFVQPITLPAPPAVPAPAGQHPAILALKMVIGGLFVAPAVMVSACFVAMIGCWLGGKFVVTRVMAAIEAMRPAPRPRHDPIPANRSRAPIPLPMLPAHGFAEPKWSHFQ